MECATSALTSLSRASRTWNVFTKNYLDDRFEASRRIPRTSDHRLLTSTEDRPLDLTRLLTHDRDNDAETVLYLGYGSNLSAETFLGKRKIRPLSQVNVVVPTLSLAFDLPGIPYSEPCFANSRNRSPSIDEKEGASTAPNDFHKDRWHKGLVGVVYEVTKSDFAHIIATEGGGSGYQDVVVDCYTLDQDPKMKVPDIPTNYAFKSHTLFAPAGVSRPNYSYAQPSARYLKLIKDGADEHELPHEYQDYLHQIRSYHLSTNKQRLGQFIYMAVWMPLFAVIFGAGPIFAKPDGTFPAWFAALARATFTGSWASYDSFFKPKFGDGERTIGDDSDDDANLQLVNEKTPLLPQNM